MWRVPRLGNRIFTTTTPRQVLFSGKAYSTSSHIAFDARNENLHKLFQLITYSAKGRVEDLKDFFDENPDFNVSMADYDGRTALHLAAEEGHMEVVKMLVERGADVNATDRWASTVLRGAVRHYQNPIAQYLRDFGAKLKIEELESIVESGESNIQLNERIEKYWNLFQAIDPEHVQSKKTIRLQALEAELKKKGIHLDVNTVLKDHVNCLLMNGELEWTTFKSIMIGPKTILQKTFNDELVIPNWAQFQESVAEIFESVKENMSGQVAGYIPELAAADPNKFGVSITSVDGQTLSLGDYNWEFPLQSCSKPLVYSTAIEDHGYEYVHQFIGKEPSGVSFNAFTLNYENKPHNACINSGAIACAGLFHPELHSSAKFKYLTRRLKALTGGKKVGFNQAVFLSEKDTAHRNFALAHYMKSMGSFPPNVSITQALDFYFQACSIDVDCEKVAAIAATYANNGVNPITLQKTMTAETVKRTMQLMFTAGMYDYSGEWSNTVGLPAKSGVAGSVFVVIPGVAGVAIFSPNLDSHGNSVRGVEFCTKIADKFSWNIFDVISNK